MELEIHFSTPVGECSTVLSLMANGIEKFSETAVHLDCWKLTTGGGKFANGPGPTEFFQHVRFGTTATISVTEEVDGLFCKASRG